MDTSDPTFIIVRAVIGITSAMLVLGTEIAVIYTVYYFITLPMRRNERSRIFLDLLALGLKDGQTPESAIRGAATSNDVALGARFHLLAAHLDEGQRLSAALDAVPRFLPPQIVAMLKTGERIGSVQKVLPACRRLLNDGVSQVRGALNYILILTFVVSPAAIFIPLMIRVMIIPKFKEVFYGMLGGMKFPPLTEFIFNSGHWLIIAQVLVVIGTWFLLFAYVGGPRVYAWSRVLLGSLPDWIHFHLPWRRKRLQRDFSAMLAVLLDAHVPETEAVEMAAQSTANSIVQRRAIEVRARLASGVKLPEALRALDNEGELQWRLSNALHRGGGFLGALNGWHDALDSKAFQQEQTAAQITTTGFLLFNGLIVACIVIGLFMPLIALINGMASW